VLELQRNSIKKCSLQNFGEYNFGKKLHHISKTVLGTIRMDSEMEGL